MRHAFGIGKEGLVAEKEEIVDKIRNPDEQDAEKVEVAAELVAEGSDSTEIDELEQARLEAAETADKLLRLAAEFENYRKRMERDRALALKYAEEQAFKELLPCIDNLERAIEQGRKAHNASDLLAGVELTYKGLMNALEKFELVPMQSIGAPFDPNIHEALAMEASGEVDPNCVLREFEKGYMYKDRLIRPAKVVVAKKN
ncbi:MAG: nucleotide exchange factor GrpE [Proteobacteria bacterium]|nr:nucleotide exchange factor GrpE [Pseudomonadota bacterium]MBU4295077.1 nucleotide exchange factor GrpE [Pseudomonadota bacterium]